MRVQLLPIGVRRNRFKTNWVASLHNPESAREVNGWRIAGLAVICVAIFATIGMVIAASFDSTPIRPTAELRPSESVDTPELCTEEQLAQALSNFGVSKGEDLAAPLKLSDEITLGGERFARLQCSGPQGLMGFEVEWRFSVRGWQLKKISRQPNG
jgi:hypothetical protein